MASATKLVLLVVISIAVAIYLDLIPSVEAYRHPMFGWSMSGAAVKKAKKEALKPTGSTGEKCDNGRNCLICEECPLCGKKHHPNAKGSKATGKWGGQIKYKTQYFSGCHKCAVWFMTPPGEDPQIRGRECYPYQYLQHLLPGHEKRANMRRRKKPKWSFVGVRRAKKPKQKKLMFFQEKINNEVGCFKVPNSKRHYRFNKVLCLCDKNRCNKQEEWNWRYWDKFP